MLSIKAEAPETQRMITTAAATIFAKGFDTGERSPRCNDDAHVLKRVNKNNSPAKLKKSGPFNMFQRPSSSCRLVARSITTAPARATQNCDVNNRVKEKSDNDETKDCSADLETFHVLDSILALQFGDVSIPASTKLILVEPPNEHE